MNWKTIALIQSLAFLLIIAMEYFNIHPMSTFLKTCNKYDDTTYFIWFTFILCPAIYAVFRKIKKAWLLILIAVSLFILLLILGVIILIKENI